MSQEKASESSILDEFLLKKGNTIFLKSMVGDRVFGGLLAYDIGVGKEVAFVDGSQFGKVQELKVNMYNLEINLWLM